MGTLYKSLPQGGLAGRHSGNWLEVRTHCPRSRAGSNGHHLVLQSVWGTADAVSNTVHVPYRLTSWPAVAVVMAGWASSAVAVQLAI